MPDLASCYFIVMIRDFSKLDLLPFPGVVKRDFGIVNKNYWFNGLLKSNHLVARRLNYMIFTIIILKICITLQLDLIKDKNSR